MTSPTGPRASEEELQGTGGTVFIRTWRPDAPRGVMILVHGFNAHSGYFAWAAEQLVTNGLAVYALDLRGRGKSAGPRFYVNSVSDYTSDVDLLVKLARSREPGLPVFILGHSAGGVISSLYAVAHQADLAGFICESFAYRVPAPGFALSILKVVGSFVPKVPVFTLKNADFSRDPSAVAAMNNDPLIAKESQPARTVRELIRASERLTREFPLITLPVLILHGTLDRATVPAGSQHFFNAVGSADKTLKLYEGHFHDLLNDVGKDGVMADITAWVEQRLPAR